MKKLKKTLSLTLALALCMALAIPALAAEPSSEISIKWVLGEPALYNRDLNWVTLNLGELNNWERIVVDLETGKQVEEYDCAYAFSDGLAMVRKQVSEEHFKYGYIDKTGTVVLPLEYDEAGNFSDGLAPVGKEVSEGNWKWGFIDKTGAMAVPFQYDNVWALSEGLAVVEKTRNTVTSTRPAQSWCRWSMIMLPTFLRA